MNFFCSDCRYFEKSTGSCALLDHEVDMDDDACDEFAESDWSHFNREVDRAYDRWVEDCRRHV